MSAPLGKCGAAKAALALFICSAAVAAASANAAAALGAATMAALARPPTMRDSPRRGEKMAQLVFVTKDTEVGHPGSAELDYWPVGTTGNIAPTGIIAGSNTGFQYGLEGVVVDSTGEIYVANIFTNTIEGFAPGSNGNVAPNVIIGGQNTGLLNPVGLAFDNAENLYVTNSAGEGGTPPGPNSIEQFARGANGNVAPVRVIAGDNAQLDQPFGIDVAENGDIYVVESVTNVIQMFSKNAQGDVAPERTIAGSDTKLNGTLGLGFGRNGLYTGTWTGDYLERFSRSANGDTHPLSVIKGKQTQLTCCLDGVYTAPNGTVYAVDRGTTGGGSPPPSILQFDGLAKGDVPPVTDITGNLTRLYIPLFVSVGSEPK